jgi:hypothetical protein
MPRERVLISVTIDANLESQLRLGALGRTFSRYIEHLIMVGLRSCNPEDIPRREPKEPRPAPPWNSPGRSGRPLESVGGHVRQVSDRVWAKIKERHRARPTIEQTDRGPVIVPPLPCAPRPWHRGGNNGR